MSRPTGWGGDPVAIPTLEALRDAAAWLGGRVVRTPLLALGGGDDDILLKPENLQPIGSFKIRGALNWARQLAPERRAPGIITCSAGNTAQALGYAARVYGVPARCNLPEDVPPSKLEAIRSYGVEPVPMPYDDLILYMLEEGWRHDPYAYLNPWGDPHMIAGSGTIGLEILADAPDVQTVFVPVGGGGLAAGVGSALKHLAPQVRVIGVQASASPALYDRFQGGGPGWVPHVPTICEGAAVPVVVDQMLPLLRHAVDEVVLVTDDEAYRTIRRLALGPKLVVEGAGAIAVAAALAMAKEARGRAVCILSGGSIGADRLIRALS